METQFFINCAHVNIIGSSTDSGSLEGYPYAKFPGTYDFMDPGEFIPNSPLEHNAFSTNKHS